MITWLIGMSGSGKTSIGRELYARLKPDTPNLVFLDGDDFREMFRNDVDHTVEGRYKNAERISHTCRMLDAQGIHVIAAVLSIFPEWQKWNRDTFGNYFEVFLDIPMQTLIERDVKGLYAKALSGEMQNFVGFDIDFPLPPAPDMTLNEADQQQGIPACVDKILAHMPALK